jgi:hypothetical protein
LESPNSDISWSVCWGGAAYTGSTTGVISDNEFDGELGPCFSGPLPSAGTTALQFTGPATAPSTNNQADYSVTAGSAVVTNNAGETNNVPVELQRFTITSGSV